MRRIALLLIPALSWTLTGCGGDPEPTASTVPTSARPTPATSGTQSAEDVKPEVRIAATGNPVATSRRSFAYAARGDTATPPVAFDITTIVNKTVKTTTWQPLRAGEAPGDGRLFLGDGPNGQPVAVVIATRESGETNALNPGSLTSEVVVYDLLEQTNLLTFEVSPDAIPEFNDFDRYLPFTVGGRGQFHTEVFDLKTGKKVWQTEPSLVLKASNGTIAVETDIDLDSGSTGRDLATGRQIWRRDGNVRGGDDDDDRRILNRDYAMLETDQSELIEISTGKTITTVPRNSNERLIVDPREPLAVVFVPSTFPDLQGSGTDTSLIVVDLTTGETVFASPAQPGVDVTVLALSDGVLRVRRNTPSGSEGLIVARTGKEALGGLDDSQTLQPPGRGGDGWTLLTASGRPGDATDSLMVVHPGGPLPNDVQAGTRTLTSPS